MMTRINFGLHASDGWRLPFETVAKCVGYNFLCAKRHFEHTFSNEPEIFHNGKWTATSSENVTGKQWHFVIGCIELIPVIGHIVAWAEGFFGKNGSLPAIPIPQEKEPNSTEQKIIQQTNEPSSSQSTIPQINKTAEVTDSEVVEPKNPEVKNIENNDLSRQTPEQKTIDNEQKIIRIQSFCRMYNARQQKEQTIAATKIQNLYRMKVAQDAKEDKIDAITKIQSYCRMNLAQLQAEKEKILFEKAKLYIDKPGKLSELYRTCGRTPVYLHDEFVIKRSGEKSQDRFKKTEQARKIIDKNHYSHLVIPKARIYKDELIEPRLPIMKGADRKLMISFYLDHRDQFTKAVEEFTGFLCKSYLHDITGGTNDSYASLCKDQIGRYENITLYLEEEEGIVSGKIGLIDLEGFSPDPQQCFFACREAVRLFPHHLETIIKTANAEAYREQLEEIRDQQLEYFKIAYEDHLAFVQAKGIRIEDADKFLTLEDYRKLEISVAVEKMMREYQEHIKEKGDEYFKNFSEQEFPKILEDVMNFLGECLKETVSFYREKQEINSLPKLISARTIEFGDSMDEPYQMLKSSIFKKLNKFTFTNSYLKNEVVTRILDTIFRELEGKEIAYYNPRFGVGSSANPCIFC